VSLAASSALLVTSHGTLVAARPCGQHFKGLCVTNVRQSHNLHPTGVVFQTPVVEWPKWLAGLSESLEGRN
jgi:hypothetical protein